jgi:hypothetical protein
MINVLDKNGRILDQYEIKPYRLSPLKQTNHMDFSTRVKADQWHKNIRQINIYY